MERFRELGVVGGYSVDRDLDRVAITAADAWYRAPEEG